MPNSTVTCSFPRGGSRWGVLHSLQPSRRSVWICLQETHGNDSCLEGENQYSSIIAQEVLRGVDLRIPLATLRTASTASRYRAFLPDADLCIKVIMYARCVYRMEDRHLTRVLLLGAMDVDATQQGRCCGAFAILSARTCAWEHTFAPSTPRHSTGLSFRLLVAAGVKPQRVNPERDF